MFNQHVIQYVPGLGYDAYIVMLDKALRSVESSVDTDYSVLMRLEQRKFKAVFTKPLESKRLCY
jgi:hypothetical protein